jgi:glutathione S-transferase
MHIELFFAPFTRSTRPRWLLEELAVPYTLTVVDLKAGAHKEASYRAQVHPMGVVPALRIDGQMLMESGAIVGFLADHFADKQLAPSLQSPQRALYWQWLMFASCTLEPLVVAVAGVQNLPAEDDKRKQAEEKFHEGWRVVEAALAGKDTLLDRFQACDVVMGSLAIWAASMKMFAQHPNLMRYCDAMRARNAYQRARK